MTYKTLGGAFPNEGGLDNQPAEWVESIQCLKAAEDKVTALIKLEMEEAERKKQEEQARKAKQKRNRR